MNARDRVLGRIREALNGRERAAHPGAFEGWRPEPPPVDPTAGFSELFIAAGGEVVRCADIPAAAAWLRGFARRFETVTLGRQLPETLHPTGPTVADAKDAALGVSMARGAIAETGSLLLDARDGRRTQLLTPTHVVLVNESDVHATLATALSACRGDLPSALALHSGPSKSADIGQILVQGVHGPGRVIAVLIGS